MRIASSRAEALAILAAMADVGAGGGEPPPAAAAAVAAAGHWIFQLPEHEGLDQLPATGPAQLAAALGTGALRQEAIRFLTVMAFLGDQLDPARISRVLAYAAALGIRSSSIEEIAAVARGQLQEAVAHMVRDNMSSLTGSPWRPEQDVAAWLLPYGGEGADPQLAARYRALASLPSDRLGRAFHDHFQRNGYAMPGEPTALNERFTTPHDTCHVLAGYDTTPHGEILVSTFTAAMHPVHPISGHVLPAIISWQLGIPLNAVARSARGELDPVAFWRAWARGEAMPIDLFAPGWDFWEWVDRPLAQLRTAWLGEPSHQSSS
ncbi:hypothetical protein KQ306_04115 [Synechococcus sp. CS-1324]|uniref:hypothetical protein n=1 Tax=unclassified Synechococcus TaxID=2626047 RepID=UPI000DB0A1F0|nr:MULTISPECIES: hypothetical protein [unclassified Synechococcus]MCT0213982.1 hypothetical protein [Synechococcus sp. CS-1326]MCT0230048.1 hypothetical protein [Synechococcus sp. CS-1324]MCT0233558.1 hypothetical protein [Synechococcus sp. CS-1327]PZV03783.1 MAG: hypothetical protein DCF23_08300 [Cyanobium sp.]